MIKYPVSVGRFFLINANKAVCRDNDKNYYYIEMNKHGGVKRFVNLNETVLESAINKGRKI